MSVPSRVLFCGPDPLTLLPVAGVTAGVFAGMVVFWRLGLRAQSSASS